MATYVYTESRIMPKQAIGSIVSTTAAVPVGTIVRAKDATLGEGEFIYLPTTASISAGNICSFRQVGSGAYTNVRTVSGASSGQPIAVAMVSGAASCFGWFQIAGTHTAVLKTAVIFSANKPCYVSTTAGRIRQVASTGRGIVGMVSLGKGNAAGSANASAVSTVVCTFNRPAQISS